jgi:hypothetical protein
MRHETMADTASGPTDLADDPTDAELAPPDIEAVAADAPAVADPRESGNSDLLGELARAMHAAATSQYERMNAELEHRRTEQVEAIAARSSSEAEHLKASTEADIGAIDAWAKAETEKVKHERLRRIDARREQLTAQLERQEAIKQREVVAIEVAIDAHRTEIDQFFGRMERETDPKAIAQVASSLPAFPSLADVADEARREATGEFENLDGETGAAPALDATATATAALDETSSDAIVSETRLMAVMDPGASQGENPDAAPPWEAPSVVSVAAGSGSTEAAAEPEPYGRVGSTLLRTVRAIRPMAGSDKDEPEH